MHILSRQLPSRATSTLGLALRLTQPTIPLTPARLTRSYSHRATTLETMATPHPHNDLARFHALLAETPRPRIMAVCGAGLSASSGLPTFRGAGGLWRNHRSMDLASAEAFERDPGLVWLFYAYRRHMAMGAEPAAGHKALAGMSEKYANFVCVSQNVDGGFPFTYTGSHIPIITTRTPTCPPRVPPADDVNERQLTQTRPPRARRPPP